MEITAKKTGSIDILCLGGRLDSYAANEVDLKLNAIIGTAPVKMIIGLDKLEYISSSGLRVLLAALKKDRKMQGDVRLSGLQPYVKEVFDIAGFSQLFKIFDKEEDAIKSFEGI